MRTIPKLVWIVALAAFASAAGAAEKKYGPGVSDTEIKLGQTIPYSGPLSMHGIQGRTEIAYFNALNEKGGINGRKINLISLDDAFSPPKTVEQTRKLVESDGVLAIFASSGTAAQTAVQKYLNNLGVPQIMLSTGANKTCPRQRSCRGSPTITAPTITCRSSSFNCCGSKARIGNRSAPLPDRAGEPHGLSEHAPTS